MAAHRSWYREKMHLTIENAPEPMLRELLLFAEALRHRLRASVGDTRRLPAAPTALPPLDA